ncbi:hypothetical protein [Streptomyces sp. NPDC058304]|uniref:hypothetical protein n=1 Tax=Streptomyces sp. NPDC058304 TaxID=3346437 RepID=UPI0036EB4861
MAVPPGTYPVEAACVEVADEDYGSYEEVTAVRLRIGDAPVAVLGDGARAG